MGWVAALRVSGGVLQARFYRLSTRLRDWLREGAYRSRSIEMYKPFEPTGRAYLAAVTFLGAQPPAVKGLSPEPSLLADGCGEIISLLESACDRLPENRGGDEMDERKKGLAARAVSSLMEVFTREDETAVGDEEDIAGLVAKLEKERSLRIAAEKRVAELERQLAELLDNENLDEFSATLTEAARQERITPAEQAGYIRLGERLDEAGRAAILAEISSREPMGLLAEISALAPGRDTDGRLNRTRAAFEGFPEDPEHDEALKLMAAETGLVFEEAILRVRLAGQVQ